MPVFRPPDAKAVVSMSNKAQSVLVVVVKVLLVIVILFMLPKPVRAGNNQGRKQHRRSELEVRSVRADCATVTCSSWVPEESLNCVYACLSPACYELVYGPEPLEDGEIDLDRFQEYDECVKLEFRIMRSRRRSFE